MKAFDKIRRGLQEAIAHAKGHTSARITAYGKDGPRELTRFTRCLHCGSATFHEGPSGGASQNVFCTECGAGYNIHLIPGGPYLDMEIRPPSNTRT